MTCLPHWYDSWKLDYPEEWDEEEIMEEDLCCIDRCKCDDVKKAETRDEK